MAHATGKNRGKNGSGAQVVNGIEAKLGTVVMSGGAPVSPLMAGFLHSLYTKGKTFKKFHTSGAGALMALLFIAPPEGATPGDALEDWAKQGVADEIYKMFPVNYKLFRKPGPFSPMFQRLAERYKVAPKQPPTRITDVLKLPVVPDTNPVKERDPIRELLAEWLARPEHGPATKEDVERRRGNALEQLYATLLNLWQGKFDPKRYTELMERKDPVKLFRDRWLESLFTSDDQRRVYNDLVDLWFAILTPSMLAPRSEGLAASLPFLEGIVDFDRLNDRTYFDGHFCVNAYNMSKEAFQQKREKALLDTFLRENGARQGDLAVDRLHALIQDFRRHQLDRKTQLPLTREEEQQRADVMEIFESGWDEKNPGPTQKELLGAKHIRAAFSMPFIYPPTELNESYYSEGADHQPINFHDIVDTQKSGEVVLLDVLATLEDFLIRRPRDLWDAYIISIMTPVVALANVAIADFKRASKVQLVKIPWGIPSETQPYVMDWSHSNLQQLFKLGQKAGNEFVKDRARDLLNRAEVFPSRPRHAKPRRARVA